MNVLSEFVTPRRLAMQTRREMLALLQKVFDNVDPSQFATDLEEKDSVVLLRQSESRTLVGFSTLKTFDFEWSGRSHRFVFSGDTVVDPAEWGSPELTLALGVRMSLLLQEQETPLYWLLISQGVRTFKILPTCFRSYVPSPERDRSEEAELLRAVATSEYGDRYDPRTGVLAPTARSYYLREEFAAMNDSQEVSRFFLSRNPGYRNGSELVCMARFEPTNLRPFVLREIARRTQRQGVVGYAA